MERPYKWRHQFQVDLTVFKARNLRTFDHTQLGDLWSGMKAKIRPRPEGGGPRGPSARPEGGGPRGPSARPEGGGPRGPSARPEGGGPRGTQE